MQRLDNMKRKFDFSEIFRKRFGFTDNDIEITKNYLKIRSEEVKNKSTFGIVYDITQFCNLNCLHCCVNAKFVFNKKEISFDTTYEQCCVIIDRIYDYIKSKNINEYFLMFGGGEPFLRPEFPEILQYASKVLGHEHVGFSTNGTIVTLEDMESIKHKVSIIEISIDGFEKYHNKWRNTHNLSEINNPFKVSFRLAQQIASDKEFAKLLEVSAIATKENIKELPKFMKYLYENGIQTASIHRCMPVGRMANFLDKVPNINEYVGLLLGIAKLRNEHPDFNIHIHHSLESIYSALLLSYDIHLSYTLGGSKRHSIGIGWNGNVFFDPWGVVPPYNKLCAGNILEKDLEEIIEDPKSPIHIANHIVKKNIRCKQCKLPCSGGMRFNALADYIGKLIKAQKGITVAHLISGLSQIDPACPIYSEIYNKNTGEACEEHAL